MQRQSVGTPMRPVRVLWFSLLAVMLCGLSGQKAATPAVSFASHVDYGAGHEPHSVVIGDFNRDGNPDLAVANAMSDTVSILLGTGTGTLGPKTDFAGGGGISIALGDFNGDGKLDLVAAKGGGSDSISILLGNGDGTFGTNTSFSTGSYPTSVAVGDFNGDRNLDVAVANGFGFSVSILLGTGTGTFGTKTDFGTGPNPLSVAVGDFNRDGNLDLVTANQSISSTVSILLGTGTGAFGAKTDIGVGSYPESVAVSDFNGDGNLDLAVAHEVGNAVSIAILLGNGNGTFGPNNDFGTGGTIGSSVAVADFNGDGKPDLANAGGSNTVSVLLGNGNGTFGPHSDFQVGFVPDSVAIADFNGDGKPDLAVANTNPTFNTISILLNTTQFLPAGVFCHKADFISGNVPYSVAIADFNRDGKLDLAVANSNSNAVTVLFGTGVGSFGRFRFQTGDGPVSVATGDFNGDGNLDLVTANSNNDTITILRGFGNNVFAPTDFGVGATPFSVAVGDFNGDGKADIVTANAGSNSVSILLGLGNLSFGARSDFGTGNTPHSVAVGDFNRDGKLDLAVANYGSNTVSILLGTGVGTFGAKTDFNTGVNPNSVALGDFNGDGKLDLAVANVGSNTVSILLGTGAGLFGAKTDFATGSAPFSVAAADFNRDGHLDLAVANLNNDNLSVLSGTGLGAFGPKTDFGTGISPRSVAVGDINGDGKLDLAVANEISGNVSVLLNTCSNNPPTINAHPLTVTVGMPPMNTPIADVSDAEDAENTLIMMINGTTSVTINGVRISGMSVNTSGLVTADVEADCSARPGTFELRVTDSGGVSCEALLTVDVIANPTPPTITCPGNIVAHTDQNLCSTVVTFAPTVTGTCSAAGGPVCSPASGSAFPKGVTTVTCHISDLKGNQSSCSFEVRVIDAQRPSMTGPGHIVKSTEPYQCSAVVTYALPTVTDNCPGPFFPTCAPPSGFRFPVGNTFVTCHVVDRAANEQTSVFEVTVIDAQAPTFVAPRNVSATAAASCPYSTSTVVTYANPAANDNCSVQSVTCNPPSGSTFPVGTTTVNCIATDSSGNIATCSFTVSVYSFCIQDELNAGNVVLVNASTGDYSFCCNGVPVASGRGILGADACAGSIDQTKGDRRVHIEWDGKANNGAGSGNAYVKSSSSLFCQITDKQLTNNSCQCSTQSAPSIIVTPSPPK